MSQPKITFYGANWCSDCRRAKKYLGEQRIHYTWRDIEEETPESQEAYEFVLSANEKVFGKPKRKIPVIEFEEAGKKSLLIEPSNVELAKHLGLATEAEKTFYDTIIIGAGPAGLTTALYLARDGYDVLVIEKSTIGGQAYITNVLDNYPGFPEGIAGEQYASNLRKQVERFGTELLFPFEVNSIGPCHDPEEGGSWEKCTFSKVGTTDGKELLCKTILIATGSKYRELVVPGSDTLTGTNIHYCATCDGAFYKNKSLFVIGGGNSAFEEALYLREKFAKEVTILYRGEKPSASPVLQEKVADREGINLWLNTEVIRVEGENSLEQVVVYHADKGKESNYQPDGIFVFIGLSPNTKFLQGVIDLDASNFIVTNRALQTSRSRIYAAGDCRRDSTKQVITAAGEGAAAAIAVRECLKTGE
ncbi:MAG: FAD-dependent oxidoreductase [Candidatus Heimdallarchaeota archaeon]